MTTEWNELVGATIENVTDRPDDAMGSSRPFVTLHVRYADDTTVNGNTHGSYEVWRDEEGNGPGELVYLGGHRKEVDVQEEEAVS